MQSNLSVFESLFGGVSTSWLVTGGAGFIGSHVVELLLEAKQQVTVLDLREDLGNLIDLIYKFPQQLQVTRGDIRDIDLLSSLCKNHRRVIHLAAMGSVPMSVAHPEQCHDINVTGTFHVFQQAMLQGCESVAYASSSAVYGDDPLDYKIESQIGVPLSPYAASKWMNEIYAATLAPLGATRFRGMRFFNVFGPRQDPRGPYAAVIPIWIESMLKGSPIYVNGSGENTRDFCFVKDIAQALILASLPSSSVLGQSEVFNVGLGQATSLLELFEHLRAQVQPLASHTVPAAIHREARVGDILHSCADTTKVTTQLHFKPQYTVHQGLEETVKWYAAHLTELSEK